MITAKDFTVTVTPHSLRDDIERITCCLNRKAEVDYDLYNPTHLKPFAVDHVVRELWNYMYGDVSKEVSEISYELSFVALEKSKFDSRLFSIGERLKSLIVKLSTFPKPQ